MQPSGARKAGQMMLNLYQGIDPIVQAGIGRQKISCKTGCSGCCRALVVTSFPEMCAVAAFLVDERRRARGGETILDRGFRDALDVQIRVLTAEGTTASTYFRGQYPCVLLGGKLPGQIPGGSRPQLCLAYDVRPAMCRYYFVRSDPQRCWPGPEGHEKQTTEQIDLQKVVAIALARADSAMKHYAPGLPFMGPMQIQLWWALVLLEQGPEAFERLRAERKDLDFPRWHAWAVQGAGQESDAISLAERKSDP